MTVTERNERKTRTGVVTSDRMEGTVVVKVDLTVRHRKYQKTYRRATKIYADDRAKQAKIGDRVVVMETRPLSKTKRWRVVEIVERAK